MSREIKRIAADVAIIGGGTAGLHAAMAAAERGLKVLVADKACIERSGAIAGGIDHFHAFLETGRALGQPGSLSGLGHQDLQGRLEPEDPGAGLLRRTQGRH